MTDQAAAAEANPDQDQAPGNEATGGSPRHVVVAGAALAAMAFVLGLWLIRGGSLGMLLGETPDLATADPAAVPQNLPVTAPEPRAITTIMAQPSTRPATPRVAEASSASARRPLQPATSAPGGTPVYVVPHAVVNPLTMLHDPAYYQQWARVGATFGNPFAYQQIMNLMMQHAMQAWGMGPPITVALDSDDAPRG